MRGDIYTNEIQDPNNQSLFITQPIRYELTTVQLWQPDYSEFITDYLEIDFVFGDRKTYDNNDQLYKPNIELYFSDDGGITFHSADVREFSLIGVYSWRLRWYQLGVSRNRVYKLICVSLVPIVILGAVHNLRKISGGAN